MNTSTPQSWIVKFRNLKLGTKILLLGIGSVTITALALVAVIAWQSSQYSALAQDEFDRLVDNDLGHITDGVYNMIVAQDESVQQLVNYSLNVARQELNATGQVSLAQDKVKWTAINQFTQQSVSVQLPKMLVGDTWLGQNTNPSIKTPIVDDVQGLVGGTATIFQRMNEQGDMLRVATNVPTADGKRAVGTYIPAAMPDGTPNPVVSTVLSGETYRGNAYVVNAWYDTAYEPIFNEAGRVIGMLYVGVKQQNVESLRQAILRTKVGTTGYVYVLGSDGDDLGRYIISQNGERDGENIWETQDAEGNYVIQYIINTAVALKPGETATVRYLWQNPEDPQPRWKIARIAYYPQWHWVIGASTYEDELATYRNILQEGQLRMVAFSGAIGLAIALFISFLAVLMARSISNPVIQLTNTAQQISEGNFDVQAQVSSTDEIGALAQTFNSMTDQLRVTLTNLAKRTQDLATVARISTTTATIQDPSQMLATTVHLTQRGFGLYHAHVFTYRTESDELQIVACGYKEGDIHEGTHGTAVIPLQQEQSLVARAGRTRKPVIVNDVRSDPNWLPNPLLPDTHAELAVPMIVGDELLGVLDVQADHVDAFTEEDANIQMALAAQIATTLKNAQSYDETKKRAELETLVNTIGQKIQRTASMEDTLQTAVREIGLALGASRVSANIETSHIHGDDGPSRN